jgi:hypothetical protein
MNEGRVWNEGIELQLVYPLDIINGLLKPPFLKHAKG